MSSTELINLFISENDGYKADLNNFINYIREYKKLPLEDTVFGGITTKDIIQSIEHNIDREQFKSVSIAQKYSVAVAQFFKYVIINKHIQNKDLLEEILAPKIDEKSYYSRINAFISKNKKLNKKESITEFPAEAINELISDCNSFIDSVNYHNNKLGFEKLAAALGIKIMLFTGIKYGVARKIKFEDIDIFTNLVKINGFNIRLPIKLSTQFQYYLKLRKQIHNIDSDGYLFVNYKGKEWGEITSSSKIPYVLGQWTGREDTTGLTKFGINNLIKAGINDSVITRLTGAEETLIKSCIRLDEKSESDKWDRYINSRISNIDLYYIL